jgi:DNA repair protein SbcD/Mre11
MLRLLHTSDWHLGQLFRDQDRTYEHQQFLTWLRGIIRQRAIDVLLVAGGLFDVGKPPPSAPPAVL